MCDRLGNSCFVGSKSKDSALIRFQHEMSGSYSYHDDFVLSEENGISAHSDWILDGKVWGENERESEVVETVQFYVHME